MILQSTISPTSHDPTEDLNNLGLNDQFDPLVKFNLVYQQFI